jgi:hypothetical protein
LERNQFQVSGVSDLRFLLVCGRIYLSTKSVAKEEDKMTKEIQDKILNDFGWEIQERTDMSLGQKLDILTDLANVLYTVAKEAKEVA